MSTFKERGEGTVVDLAERRRLAAEALPSLQTTKSAPYCSAHAFELNGEQRLVTCKRCKAELSAYDALTWLARHWDTMLANRRVYEDDNKRLLRERDALRTEVTNLKAQRRRLVKS